MPRVKTVRQRRAAKCEGSGRSFAPGSTAPYMRFFIPHSAFRTLIRAVGGLTPSRSAIRMFPLYFQAITATIYDTSATNNEINDSSTPRSSSRWL